MFTRQRFSLTRTGTSGDLTSLENARLAADESVEFEVEEGFETFSSAGNPLALINKNPVVVVQAGWSQQGGPICV